MTAKWVEVYGDSRAFTVDRENISKDFVFVIYEDDGTENFADNLAPVYFDGIEMFLDDDKIHQEVFRKVRGYIPMYYEFYTRDRSYILFVSTIRCKQLHWGAWEVQMTFDIPKDNNQTPSPDEPDELTNEFVQIAFNGTAETKKIQSALVTEATYSRKIKTKWDAAPSGSRGPKPTVPYIPSTKALIGHTKEGIEGAEVFGRHFSFQITQYMSPQKLKTSYIRKLTRMISCLNDRDFFGFAPGSIMFKGYQAQGDLFQNVPVTFEFDHRPNFKFTELFETVLANPDDIRDSSGRLTTQYQYDTISEKEFDNTYIGNGTSKISPKYTSPGIYKYAVPASSILAAYSTLADDLTLAGFDWPYDGINGEQGVHSGWSIISYLYEDEIDVNAGTNIHTPAYRIIYQPYEYVNFEFLQL